MESLWKAGPATRQLILEIFPTVTFEEAVVLVGLFHDFDFEFNDRSPQVRLRPLEPQLGAAILADIYGLDPDQLFLGFYRKWANLRESELSKGLLTRFTAHPGMTQFKHVS